ncbi:SusC/RagA family TonB-linked outer membrane protein [Flavivirga eckloniae]|uniref:TonB-dependent receptor plug domain-containing protein n=1 Tax=Flavivirga eckloniae TaxID=1803846 RepID=A0A2K9PVZ5_9FLAO|nr:SusC/RagA family TonB-linked outer membrane protein [Flavivirga eckloniae]AUP81251.1 hypothetical protein C1H87_22045 [Flavivirga eckloniae]
MEIKLTNVLFFSLTTGIRKKLLIIIMRTFIFLFCATVFGFSPNNVLSQNAKIKIDADKTLSVDEVFTLITDQTDYAFIYQADLFKDSPKIVLKKGVIKANELLKQSLSSGRFDFSFTNANTIVIKKTPITLQQITVSGKVINENGAPLAGIGVVVVVIDPNNRNSDYLIRGTSTDFDGGFKIIAESGNNLVVSGIGYETYEEKVVSNKTTYNITLIEKANELDEVVIVHDGFQSKSIEKTTGAYNHIKTKEIERQIGSSLTDALEGLTAGLTINTFGNGLEGDNNIPRFFVRGVGTFGNTQPLIVLDGFPIDAERLELISNQDIESVTLLKDAAAASIWGAGGANGVLVITSKKGKKGKTSFSLRNTITVQQRPDLSYLNLVSSQDAINIERDIFNRDPGGLPVRSDFENNNTPYSPVYDALFSFNEGTINQTQLDSRLADLASYNNSKEIENSFLNAPITNITNFSFSGATDKLNYYGAFNHIKEEIAFVGDKNKTININLKTDYQVNDKTNIKIATNYVIGKYKESAVPELRGRFRIVPQVFNILPYQRLRDENGNPLAISGNYPNSTIDKIIGLGGKDLTYRPLDDLNDYDFKNKENTTRINATIRRDIFNGLSAELSYLYQKTNNLEERLFTDRSYFTRNFLVETAAVETDITTGEILDYTQALPDGSIKRNVDNQSTTNSFRAQLNFNKSFTNGKHKVDAILGTERRKMERQRNTYSLFGFNEGNLSSIPADLTIVQNPNVFLNISPNLNQYNSAFKQDERLSSYYFNGSYLFNSKYGFTASGRIDRSSQFSLSKQFLGSAGLKWNIDREAFFNVKWINNLDIRGTWGILGNAPLIGESTLVNTGRTGNHFLTNDVFISITNPANKKLTFEVTETKNLGLDFVVFNNRISGSIDYYNKVSSDIISTNITDPTSGFFNVSENIADITNKGLELRLNTVNVKLKDFKWSTDINLSYNKNDVDHSNVNVNNVFGNNAVNLEGYPAYSIFGFRFAGLNDAGLAQAFRTNENGEQVTTTNRGDLVFEDLEHVGTAIPKTTIGFGNNITYKGFDLYFRFIYNGGHILKLEEVGGFNLNSTGELSNTFNNSELNYWQNPGDEENTSVPALGTDIFNYTLRSRASDLGFAPADYLKLRQVILSYTLDKKWLQKTPISSVKLHFQARNLWYWAKNNHNIDPEAYLPQTGQRTLPVEPSYSFGATINF